VINSRSGSSAPAGFCFPREVIAVAVRWYLRYGLSYRDVEELLAERGDDATALDESTQQTRCSHAAPIGREVRCGRG
jgi:transposase-like protein